MAAVNCTSDSFPFVFYDDAGEPVDGVVNDLGICTFPSSSCGEGLPGCCAPKPYTTGTYYMFIAFAVIFVPKFFVGVYFNEINERDPNLLEDVKFDKKPGWINSRLLKHLAWLWDFGIWVGVTVLIIMPIFMKPSIQQNLTVSSRTALQSAEAFLVPYKEIFQFVEDIISIRINYALSRGDMAAANSLTHLGIAGAMMTGVIASGFASILGAIPRVLQALTNPGMKSDLALYPGCGIIEEAANSQDLILRYWMIEVWKFPATQVTMVLVGFMYGALEYNLAGWIMAIGWAMLPLIWFMNLSKSTEPLILLALGEFAVPYCMLLLSLLYLVSPLGRSIREFTGVELSISQLRKSFRDLFSFGRPNVDSPAESTLQTSLLNDSEGVQEDQTPVNDSSGHESSAGGLIKEGLCIMFLDVAVQLAKTLAIYKALRTDAATAYQLTALDSELPSFGIAYTTGMAFEFKILGPIFLTIKEYGYFFKMARLFLICAFLLIPLIIGSTTPFLDGLALRSGQNACEYAYSNECAPFFTNVYGPNATGGIFTLYHTYCVFSFGTATECIYIVTRAMILTMLDFGYILRCTVVAMLVYAVALIVVSVAKPFGNEALSLWIVMYVPQVVLVVCFLGRLHTLFRRMVKGEVKGALRNRFRRKFSPSQSQRQEIDPEVIDS